MPPQRMTLSKAAWSVLLSTAGTVVVSVWTFSLQISGDIRELKTHIQNFETRTSELRDRVERLESPVVSIRPRQPVENHN